MDIAAVAIERGGEGGYVDGDLDDNEGMERGSGGEDQDGEDARL